MTRPGFTSFLSPGTQVIETVTDEEVIWKPSYINLDNGEMTLVRIDTIDAAINEFVTLYKGIDPYIKIPILGGDCYQWSPVFIDNCLIAFATDRLTQFTEDELIAFYQFINFENYHSTSARDTDANGTSVGCTIPNSKNESFVVADDGDIQNGLDGNTKQLCQPPTYEVDTEGAWKSLDQAFMNLYNCLPIIDCNKNDSMENLPCS